MHIARRALFRSEALHVGHIVATPSSSIPGEIECQNENVIVLPLTGVFAKHDNSRQYVVATANHSVFIAAGVPYRISYPAGIGDRCLTFRFSGAVMAKVAPQAATHRRSASTITSCGLLPPSLMLARSLLLHRLSNCQPDPLEVEEIGLRLLGSTLRTLCRDAEGSPRRDSRKRLRAAEAVKEAVSLNSDRKWTLADLAELANVSPYHLSHLFQRETGVSVYRYVLRTRLSKALNAVLDTETSLTAIALEAGFASHSHFTSAFRGLFNLTPTELRSRKDHIGAAQLRKIMTAN